MKQPKNVDTETKPMTIAEYEQKYSSKEKSYFSKNLITLVVTTIFIVVLIALFKLFKEVYEINEYAGYVVGGISLIAFVVFLVVPLVRINKQRHFEVIATARSVSSAKRHNAQLRKDLADKIIDCYVSTEDGNTWYNSETVRKLMLARKNNDEKGIKDALTQVYTVDIKQAKRRIITNCAIRSATLTAVSPNATLDVVLSTTTNIQMIKDIVFLYGFRPSDSRMMKIYSSVLAGTAASYGLNAVGSIAGKALEKVPVLGTIIDSAIQGIGNAITTAIIGNCTVKALMAEYNMQSVLDDIELTESDMEFESMCDEIKTQLKAKLTKKSA